MRAEPPLVKTHSKNHLLLLITCDRPEKYIKQTLASLRNAGVDRWEGPKVVLADGYDPRGTFDLSDWEVLKLSNTILGSTKA
ncbi:MAG: hypothetical protein ACRD2L_08165, partial [Terriglobia bacterium]